VAEAIPVADFAGLKARRFHRRANTYIAIRNSDRGP